MDASQFQIFTSSDIGGPGVMYGSTGSLITVLDACLVNGYSGKYVGWTKPFGSLSSSISAYYPPSGSRLYLFVNDMGPNATAGGKEAWCVGWENMTGLTSSVTAQITGSVGAGSGQFPTPAQLLTTGHVVARKSATTDATTQRSWIIAADAYTCYVWISTGDVAGIYSHFGFGDVYSLKGNTDTYRCFIYGRVAENVAVSNAVNQDFTDLMSATYQGGSGGGLLTALPGHFMARTYGGLGTSITITRKADILASGGYETFTPFAYNINGLLQMPNGTDNSVYLASLWVVESAVGGIRGRWRGLYQVCHSANSFADGQTFSGAGDYAGKTFIIIKNGPSSNLTATFGSNLTFWALETSPTIETN